jgi:non-ribosomal peptide synthetase component E (peptide arylation enzyme)
VAGRVPGRRPAYAEYAEQVEQFTAILRELEVGPGQAVAIQLPNWWQVNALTGEVVVIGEQDDGWYDTGDLVVPDGRGGIRVVGPAVDRIGVGWMIPAADVEDALRAHPDIDDAALVGYGQNSDRPCAVVVARRALTLEQVRDYLDGINMTEWYQPTRLERVPVLPRGGSSLQLFVRGGGAGCRGGR